MSTFAQLVQRFRSSKSPPSAVALRAGADEAAAAIPGLIREVEALTAQRAAALLDRPDVEVEALEKKIALAIRERDRAAAAVDELTRRAEAAEKAEADAALQAEIDAAEKAAARAARQIYARYEALASELGGLLSEAVEADKMVSAARFSAFRAGREITIKQVEERITDGRFSNLPFIGSTSLRPVGEFRGFGLAKEQAELLGGPQGVHQPT